MVKEEGDAEDLNAAAEVVRYDSKKLRHKNYVSDIESFGKTIDNER